MEVFLFAGGLYARYDKPQDRVDEGYPFPIAEMWPGMEDIGFSNDIAAATDLFAEINP